MHPPNWFVRALEAFDPLLSVRWGNAVGAWVIDRKANIPESEIFYLTRREARLRYQAQVKPRFRDTFKNVAEELISAKAGKRVVMTVKVLNDKVITNLMLGDIQRYGGYSRYADELEAREAAMARDLERIQANERHAMNLEVADMLHFLWRKKEDALLNGHRNMNYLLHGQESNRPLIKLAR